MQGKQENEKESRSLEACLFTGHALGNCNKPMYLCSMGLAVGSPHTIFIRPVQGVSTVNTMWMAPQILPDYLPVFYYFYLGGLEWPAAGVGMSHCKHLSLC